MRRGSVTPLSLVPIETCLKNVLIFKWQEQRAAGDGSLFLRAWLWAEWVVVDFWFVTSHVWSVLCQKFIAGLQGGRLLGCLVLAADTGWGAKTFWEKAGDSRAHHVSMILCAPMEGMCSTGPPRGPGRQSKSLRNAWEKHDPSWTPEKRESWSFP